MDEIELLERALTLKAEVVDLAGRVEVELEAQVQKAAQVEDTIERCLEDS